MERRREIASTLVILIIEIIELASQQAKIKVQQYWELLNRVRVYFSTG